MYSLVPKGLYPKQRLLGGGGHSHINITQTRFNTTTPSRSLTILQMEAMFLTVI